MSKMRPIHPADLQTVAKAAGAKIEAEISPRAAE